MTDENMDKCTRASMEVDLVEEKQDSRVVVRGLNRRTQ